MMTTPQFSLRRLLLLVTITGVLCIIPAVAADDLLWLIAPLMALAALVVLGLVAALLFAIVSGPAAVMTRQQAPPDDSRDGS